MQPIKHITISRKTTYRAGSHEDTGRDVEVYVVEVVIFGADGAETDSHTSQYYDTLAEAQAYAAEIAQRDLRPFDLAHLLEPR